MHLFVPVVVSTYFVLYFILQFLLILLSVPPTVLPVTTEPSTIHAGGKTVVHCNVDSVKPVENLDIQLLNGTAKLSGNVPLLDLNSDGKTHAVIRPFHVIFSK